MAYADTYNTASDAEIFQKRCYVAAWMVAQDIISTPIQDTTPERKAWANRVLREALSITPRQLAFQVLRDPTVLAGLGNATDEQILTAVISRLNDLVAIG